jgi:hypothetical protein
VWTSVEGSIWFQDEGSSISVQGQSSSATYSVKDGLKTIFGAKFDFKEKVWRIGKSNWEKFDKDFRAKHLPTLSQIADAAHLKRVKEKEKDLESQKEGEKRKRDEVDGEEMVKLSKHSDGKPVFYVRVGFPADKTQLHVSLHSEFETPFASSVSEKLPGGFFLVPLVMGETSVLQLESDDHHK